MVEPKQREHARLDRECAVFSQYLVQQPPTEFIRAKYRAGVAAVLPAGRASGLDRAFVLIGAAHPLLTRLTDAYARFLLPRSVLRVKLVLLLAILETVAPTEARFRRTKSGQLLLVLLALTANTLLFALTLLIAIVLFAPIHLVLLLSGQTRTRSARDLAVLERS